jgi:hypothetical protein
MKRFVFLGPSLPLAQAQALCPQAEFLPPVALGDLFDLVHTRRAKAGDVVAIVDGLFEQVPAVWHKEILFALERGVHVWGASSMGALRAAELQPFGMRAVGRIAAAFVDGQLEDDDEVVVAHATAEQGFRSLSQAMVSLRFGLQSLLAAGQLELGAHDALVAHAKALHYSDRGWAAVLAHAKSLGRPPAEISALKALARQPDAKAQDAMLLLRELSATPVLPAFVPAFTLERTAFWQALVHSRQLRQAQTAHGLADDVSAAAVLAHVRALDPQRHLWRQQAMLMKLVDAQADTATVSTDELKASARRIADRLGLRTADQMLQWRQSQGLGTPQWQALLRLSSLVERLVNAQAHQLDAYEVLAIKQSGRWAQIQDALNADDLQAWYEERCGPMLPTPERHAQALGFESLRDFVHELLSAYMLHTTKQH